MDDFFYKQIRSSHIYKTRSIFFSLSLFHVAFKIFPLFFKFTLRFAFSSIHQSRRAEDRLIFRIFRLPRTIKMKNIFNRNPRKPARLDHPQSSACVCFNFVCARARFYFVCVCVCLNYLDNVFCINLCQVSLFSMREQQIRFRDK